MGARWIGWLLSSAIIGAAPVGGWAEPMFELGSRLPRMLFRACPTAEDAKLDAERAAALGALELSKKEDREAAAFGASEDGRVLRNPRCVYVYAWVTPLREELSIAPYQIWTLAYDEAGRDTAPVTVNEDIDIPVEVRLQSARHYYSKIRMPNGAVHEGWVEFPDEPYAQKYLREREKERR